jgi:hypothetical protein
MYFKSDERIMEKSDTKTKIFTGLGILLGLLAVFAVKQFLFAPPSIDEALLDFASEFNKSCPISVDEETRLDNTVPLPNRVLQYNYTLVNTQKAEMDIAVFEELMEPVLINNMKTNPDMSLFKENGVTLAYLYRDKNGEFVTKIDIDPEKYLDE